MVERIDPFQPAVDDIVDPWFQAVDFQKQPVPVSLSLRLILTGLDWLRQLIGPATALQMFEGLRLGYIAKHAHDCGDPHCPLNVKNDANAKMFREMTAAASLVPGKN